MIIINIFAKYDGKLLNFRKNVARLVSKRRGRSVFSPRTLTSLFCALTVCLCATAVYKRAEPIALGALETVIGARIEEISVRAVRDVLSDNGYVWSDFCTKTLGDDGGVVSLSANTENIGKMCADVVQKINREVSEAGHIKISVPLGSVIAPRYFSGKGPSLSVRAVPYVSVSASAYSEMLEAGINQTLHRISINVVSDVRAICMQGSVTFRKESTVLLAESVIVGKVPIVT